MKNIFSIIIISFILFSCKKHPQKLPDGCDDMQVLRALKPCDIEEWLDEGYQSKKINLTSKNALKLKLSSLLTGTESNYKDALDVLENHHLQCSKGAYSQHLLLIFLPHNFVAKLLYFCPNHKLMTHRLLGFQSG